MVKVGTLAVFALMLWSAHVWAQPVIPGEELEAAACRIEYDFDADGAVDVVHTQAFDAAGRMIERREDQGDFGPFDTITRFEYDEAGRLSRELADLDSNGTPDRVTSYEYDGHSGFVRQDVRLQPDDSLMQRFVRSYDAAERVVEERHEMGSPPYFATRSIFEYDEQGRCVSRLFGDLSSPDFESFTPSERISFAYDDAGRMISQYWDEGADGSMSAVTHLEYSEDGRLERVIRDTDMDGTVEESAQYEYGLAPDVVTVSTDLLGDGVINARARYVLECGDASQ